METFSLPAPSGASGALLDPASKSLSPSTPLILPSSAGPVQIRQLSVSATTHSARARARSFTDICLSHNAHCTHALAHAMINRMLVMQGPTVCVCESVCDRDLPAAALRSRAKLSVLLVFAWLDWCIPTD